MLTDENKPIKTVDKTQDMKLTLLLDQLINQNVEMGFKMLSFLQTYWNDFLTIEDIFDPSFLTNQLEIA
ncbi:hypothetical protein ACNVED_12620 [Legionella sp. D16C41]|uniref:hypothetical protein n=1 Tax=Legionella sp. D16C41 TaxID=3402688 RepID=UPI003AF9386B